MASNNENTFPTPAAGAGGEAVMLANIAKVLALKNTSAGWADSAEYVLEQTETWLGTITPTD